MTNRAVAAELGVAEESVSRVLKQLKVKRTAPPDHSAQRRLNEARREHRLHVAKTLSVKDAAAAANCSVRTIYRFRNKK